MKIVTSALLPWLFVACEEAPGFPEAAVSDATEATALEVEGVEAVEEVQASGLSLSVDTGDEVLVQTVVTLLVVAEDGVTPPAKVSWSVDMPLEAGPVGLPEVTRGTYFELNRVGAYTFTARALDASGAVVAVLTRTIKAVPTMGLHVELTWQTPGDPDPFDVATPYSFTSVGSDLDLHFVRGDGNYFGPDDFYFAGGSQPTSGFDTEDKPRLDRDDSDGLGPENLNLSSFEPDVIYRVGVHYRDDAGFGESFARLRIFIDGVLIDDWGQVRLDHGDMWSSHHIMEGGVVRLGDGPMIDPREDNGFGNAFVTLRVYFGQALGLEWQHVELAPGQTWRAFTIVDDTVTPIGAEPTIEGP